MPVLKAPVDDALKSRFRQFAEAQGLSESACLRSLILAALDGGQATKIAPVDAPAPASVDWHRYTVRLPNFLLHAATERARLKGMSTNRWIVALVQSNLTGKPVMTDAEITALLASNRELAAIGRNMNQIARALNERFHETDRVKIETLAELKRYVAANRRGIQGLIKASLQGWANE